MSCENFTHEQFNVSDVSLFQRIISSEEKDILRGFIDGVSGFQNPVGSAINGISSKLVSAVGDGEDVVGYLEGVVGAENLLDKARTLQTRVGNFENHTKRLSGVNLEVGEDGLPNISGIAGMASAYTDAKMLLAEAGAPVEDNFSQMFGGIAGGGQQLVKEAGDIMNSLDSLDLNDLGAIANMESLIDDIGCRLETAQLSDIEAFDKAGDYLNKLSVGNFAISMNQSSNFNKILGDLVTKPDLLEKVQGIPKPEIPNIDDVTSGFKFPEIPNLPEIPEL